MQKSKNPQDATLRNINALKKRIKILEEEVVILNRFNHNLVFKPGFLKLFKEEGLKVIKARKTKVN